jgi:hypothetical protein
MKFMMKKFAQAPRRSRSRLAARGIASCETLECRQLMSTGMQLLQEAGPTAISASGGWEPRWIDMAPIPVSTGEQIQVVSNLGGGSLGVFTQPGQGGAPIQFMSRGGMGSLAGSTVTSSSMSTLPQGLDVQYGGGPGLVTSGVGTSTTNTASSIAALPGGAALGTGGAQGPVQIVDGAGSTVTGSTVNALPGGAQTVAGGAPILFVSRGSADARYGATVTSPSMGASPIALKVVGGQGLPISVADRGAMGTQQSIGTLPGPVQISTGGAQSPVLGGGIAGSTADTIVASSSASNLPNAVMLIPGGAPMQMVSGTQSQASASSNS